MHGGACEFARSKWGSFDFNGEPGLGDFENKYS